MNVAKVRLIAVGAVVVLLLITVGIGYNLLTRPPEVELVPESKTPVEQSAPEVAPPAKQSPPNFDQKIGNFMRGVKDACASGESREITLVFTEAEINSKIPQLLSKTNIREAIPLDIKSARVDFHRGDTVTLLATVDTYGTTISVEGQAIVSIEAGKPEITIVDIRFGRLFLPSFIKNYIIKTISGGIKELPANILDKEIASVTNVSWEITALNIGEEQLTITLVIKPRDTAD